MANGAVMLQIRSNCVIKYTQSDRLTDCGTADWMASTGQFQGFTIDGIAPPAPPRHLAYSGGLTSGGRKRLSRAIDLLVQSSRLTYGINEVTGKKTAHRLSFITLTVANNSNLTGRQAYDLLLVHFLQWLRRTAKVNTYVWKAELQVRGQIHYHITTPSWIHYNEVRHKWNTLQQQAGLLTEYYANNGHWNPNSTDIHEVKHVHNLSGYMQKEFCKSIQNPYQNALAKLNEQLVRMDIMRTDYDIEVALLPTRMKEFGKLWDCSTNLKSNKFFTITADYNTLQHLTKLESNGKLRRLSLEQCDVLSGKPGLQADILNVPQMQQYDSLLQSIRNHRQ